jgi:hypothetical protein
VLAFARLHLEEGRAADGSDLLPPAAVAEMQQPQVESPFPGEEQALGWTVRRWGSLTCLGQDADTIGQRAFLRVVPQRHFAMCVLTNSAPGAALGRELIRRVAADLLDVDGSHAPAVPPSSASPSAADVADRYAGSYERLHQRIEVTPGPQGLALAIQPSGVLGALGVDPVSITLRTLDPETGAFVGTDPLTGADEIVAFSGDRDGARGLYLAGRLHRRID